MSRKLTALVALAIGAFLLSPVRAADVAVPVKATPAWASYPIGSGVFYGVSASSMAGNASAAGTSGNVVGGRFGLDVGYTGFIGNTFYFVEASASVQALSGASNVLDIASTVGFEQRFAIGVPPNVWNSIVAAVPGLGGVAFPTVPALSGITAGPSQLYAFGALYEDDVSATLGTASGKSWLVSYGAGVGVLNRLSNGMMLDTSIEWKHGAGGLLVGSSDVKPFADSYLATMRLKL